MSKKVKIFLSVICIIFFFGIVIIVTPLNNALGTWWNNKVNYAVQKIDDSTNYDMIKKVEDTCRAMISSYYTDKLTYEQYKNSDNDEKQSWAEQAKMRANKTASTYNNYILENSFIWKDNIPENIVNGLLYLE